MVKAIKRYLSIFKGVKLPWISMIITLALAILEITAEVESATLTANIIDASRNTIKSDMLIQYAVLLISSGALLLLHTYFNERVSQSINLGVRTKMWDKLMRLPTKYYDGENANELVSRVTSDSASASSYFILFVNTLSIIFSTVIVFRRLFSFEPTLSAWMLLIIPCTIGVGTIYAIVGHKAGFATNKTFAATTGYMAERVHNLKLVKAFVMEKPETDASKTYFRKQYKAEMIMELTLAIMDVGSQVLSIVSMAIAFIAGGAMVANGTLTVGRLVSFYTLSGIIALNMTNFFTSAGTIFEVNGLVKKISHIFELDDEPTEGKPFETEDDIKLEHVSFAYNEIPVLKDVNCTIRKGCVTAIIGTNGAGKSTIFKLLERMYNVSEGAISIGETNINEYSIPSWRRQFALVAQNTPLMDGTVRENMLYGIERDVTDEELIEAAKLANAYDFIVATPGGFDEPVGAGGSKFSGGQRQCISIARAILRKTLYLLLDEATSNLDALSENMVTTALDRLMKGKTTVMIAHSYRATQEADDIIIMKDGTIAEMGTPAELLANSEYYRMFMRQTRDGDNNL